jgi:hypothetical protein
MQFRKIVQTPKLFCSNSKIVQIQKLSDFEFIQIRNYLENEKLKNRPNY